MKILHLMSHLNVGGIPRYVLALSRWQVARGHVVIVASGGGSTKDQLEAIGARHWPLPLHTSAEFSLPVLAAARQLADRLASEPVDILHAHTRVGQVVADRVGRRLAIPYVTTWHGIYKRRLGRRLWPCTGRFAIAISELVRRHLVREFRVPPERVQRIYNGVDVVHYAAPPSEAMVQQLRSSWRLPGSCPVIGAVGRLAAGRVKGFDVLLKAAALLQQKIPAFSVLIVGDGPQRPSLERMARRLGVQDRVRFVGEVSDVRLPLALIDLFVFSSRWPEAFGLTLIEAMAAGKAVVATEAGAVPEVIRHDVDGWLVPPDDPAAMAQSLAHLLRHPDIARRLSSQARSRVQETFSLERMAAEIEAVYRKVLPQPSVDDPRG